MNGHSLVPWSRNQRPVFSTAEVRRCRVRVEGGMGRTDAPLVAFDTRKVPRELRRSLPVVEARGQIVWVAGVAVDERFAMPEGPGAVGLSARRRS